MVDNQLISGKEYELSHKRNNVVKMVELDNCIFLILDNDQKYLITKEQIYDVSNFDQFTGILDLSNEKYAKFIKEGKVKLVDLKTMNIIFEDERAYSITKEAENTLCVIMHHNEKAIYNIETKAYLTCPPNYEYELSLGEGLYVFCEKNNRDFYEKKRCIINDKNQRLIDNISGFVYYKDQKLIIIKQNSVSIVTINPDGSLTRHSIEQNDKIIKKPQYHDGNLILIKENCIAVYDLELNIKKTIEIPNLIDIKEITHMGNILYLMYPEEIRNKPLVYVDLETGNFIEGKHIEGYPYWNPKTFIVFDTVKSYYQKFSFYNEKLELLYEQQANCYEIIDSDTETMFLLSTQKEDKIERVIYNSQINKSVKVNYDYINFPPEKPYGYGVDSSNATMDFFDKNLQIVIPNLNYKKYELFNNFSYDILNNYICITKRFIDGFGRERFRTIIQKSDGDVILDSLKERCITIGDFFQITSDNDSRFLNTITGKIGVLQMGLPIDANGDVIPLQKDNYYIGISNEPALLPEPWTNKVKQLKNIIKIRGDYNEKNY